ncbi:unnamed protein product [Nesidiocoris tenuis]|uniref:Uncharacterized protein n=1 Tax=Nesidiocoris tenuis TaxID=355587 RepID=A0A6H5HDH8_9HEMI|nr:unnamed protein product [Nesidiocoris tenuis]
MVENFKKNQLGNFFYIPRQFGSESISLAGLPRRWQTRPIRPWTSRQRTMKIKGVRQSCPTVVPWWLRVPSSTTNEYE